MRPCTRSHNKLSLFHSISDWCQRVSPGLFYWKALWSVSQKQQNYKHPATYFQSSKSQRAQTINGKLPLNAQKEREQQIENSNRVVDEQIKKRHNWTSMGLMQEPRYEQICLEAHTSQLIKFVPFINFLVIRISDKFSRYKRNSRVVQTCRTSHEQSSAFLPKGRNTLFWNYNVLIWMNLNMIPNSTKIKYRTNTNLMQNEYAVNHIVIIRAHQFTVFFFSYIL